jgi:hypothetical protein
MPKPRNSIPSETIKVTTTPAVRVYLEELVKEGLYGKNPSEAADRLLARGIENLIKEGALRRLSTRGKK